MGERERQIDLLRAELQRVVSDEEQDRSRLRELALDDLIELGDALRDLDERERLTIFESLPPEAQAELIEEADEDVRSFFVQKLAGDDRFPGLLELLPPDDAADILGDLSEQDRDRLLARLDHEAAETIRELASYDPDSAGGLMTTEFLAVPEDMTVQGVKDVIRAHEDLETIDNIFVGAGDRLLGVFSARDLILADNADHVRDIMTTDVVSIDVHADAEECYRVMETYHLSSLPVVDQFHDLLGIVTFDDVLTVGQAEASEDVFRMAGSGDIRPTRDSVLGRVRKRLPYLLVSVLGGFGSAFVLKGFGLEEVSEVMYFLPMIVMLGGNIATQSSAVMVRGFATGEIDAGEIPRVIVDEFLVGLVVGAICAACGGFVAYLLGEAEPLRIAAAVLAAISALSGISALLGTTVPSACHRLEIDPAISAGPFITVSIDMIGCAVYLAFVVWFGISIAGTGLG